MAWFLARWFRRLWQRQEATPPPPLPSPDAPPSIPNRPRRKPVDPEAVHAWGEYYFRGAILDQLDRYFVLLERMQRGDNSAYQYFSRVGAHVVPLETMGLGRSTDPVAHQLSPWWRETLPAQGAVFWCHREFEKHEDENKASIPRALYFTRYKRSGIAPCVQPVSEGAIYKLTVYWDRPDKPKIHPTPTEYPVVIAPDGSVRILRTLTTKHQAIRVRHGPDRGQKIHIPVRRWEIAEFYHDWAKEHDADAESYLRHIFLDAAFAYENANSSMTRVTVTKKKLAAVFAVDIERTPYFFRDRDVTINGAGVKQKIFHIVRPHRRILAGGRATFVQGHFRGEREFEWNGFHISISVPGYHHLSVADIDVQAIDSDSDEAKVLKATGERMIGTDVFGRRVRNWMQTGLGGRGRDKAIRPTEAERRHR